MQVIYGAAADIDSWMQLVTEVREEFPGLETQEALADYRGTVLRFMDKRQAVCMKDGGHVVGVLLFSRKRNMICCLAVDPVYRRQKIASALLTEALRQLDPARDITVTTFREGDPRGLAPRALYRKFGFVPGELVVEFNYPNQIFVRHP